MRKLQGRTTKYNILLKTEGYESFLLPWTDVHVWCYFANSWSQHILFQAAVRMMKFWRWGLHLLAAEMIARAAFQIAEVMRECSEASERTYMVPCGRTWGDVSLRWEMISVWVAAIGPAVMSVSSVLPLLPSYAYLLALCFSSVYARVRRNVFCWLLRVYHSWHPNLAASHASVCSKTFEGHDRTCVSQRFLQVTGLPLCHGHGCSGRCEVF